MTLYRKYRPQKLSELDSSEVRDRLLRVFSSSFTPHALLFAGPKGTGKTSAARIVAKVINCEKRLKLEKPSTSIEPCNKCETCISITAGTNLDVFEIDAASNRGDRRNTRFARKNQISASGGEIQSLHHR